MRSSFPGLLALPALLLTAPACKDAVEPPRLGSIELTAPSTRVEAGQTLQVSAAALSDAGTPMSGVAFTWSTTDTAVATVSTGGLVTAKAPGSTRVRATSGAVTGELELTVVPATVAEVAVRPDTVALAIGSTARLDATARDAGGRELTGRRVSWSSSDSAVASVAADGAVLARAPGQATVTAEVEGKRGTARITVVELPAPSLRLEVVVSGILASYVTAPPGDPRLFAAGLDGRIWIVQGGSLLPEPFLDLREKVKGVPHGLYGIAFHPRFSTNGFVYVHYVDKAQGNRIERYTVGADRNRADPASAKTVLTVAHPEPYDHYGGWLGFGPDGKLYVALGDGGKRNSANAQNRGTLLGKIVRIDVDQEGGAEIWATGLRNPWRASFDFVGGHLYVADVGEDAWEEVNVAPATQGGVNYGWNRLEGSHCFPAGTSGCDRTGTHLPVLEYPLPGSAGEAASAHPSGCSVTGGYVYRGSRIPALRGHYFYGDFCRGWVRSFRYERGSAAGGRQWFTGVGQLVSFGEDAAGELYVVAFPGTVYRIVPAGT